MNNIWLYYSPKRMMPLTCSIVRWSNFSSDVTSQKNTFTSHMWAMNKTLVVLVIYRIILYCWWKKSCTTGYVWNPVNNGTFNTVFTNDVGIILSHSKDPVMNQPGFHGMSSCFFFVAHMGRLMRRLVTLWRCLSPPCLFGWERWWKHFNGEVFGGRE